MIAQQAAHGGVLREVDRAGDADRHREDQHEDQGVHRHDDDGPDAALAAGALRLVEDELHGLSARNAVADDVGETMKTGSDDDDRGQAGYREEAALDESEVLVRALGRVAAWSSRELPPLALENPGRRASVVKKVRTKSTGADHEERRPDQRLVGRVAEARRDGRGHGPHRFGRVDRDRCCCRQPGRARSSSRQWRGPSRA